MVSKHVVKLRPSTSKYSIFEIYSCGKYKTILPTHRHPDAKVYLLSGVKIPAFLAGGNDQPEWRDCRIGKGRESESRIWFN